MGELGQPSRPPRQQAAYRAALRTQPPCLNPHTCGASDVCKSDLRILEENG